MRKCFTDTWLEPVEDDPMDDYDRYANWEEAVTRVSNAYLDRLDASVSWPK